MSRRGERVREARDLDEAGRCLLTCAVGPKLDALDDPLDANKCRGREDLRCGKLKGSATVCVPTCGSDAECGAGRACDPRASVCVTTPNIGVKTGAKCDPNEMPTPCAGMCVGFTTGNAMCSSACVLGGKGLDASDCGGPENGLCAFRPDDNGAGDFGYCTPSCVSHDACQNPAFFCFSLPGFTDALGKGYCFAAVPCPNGQSDCVEREPEPAAVHLHAHERRELLPRSGVSARRRWSGRRRRAGSGGGAGGP